MSKRILVVDDAQALRELLQDALEEETYSVDLASNGLEALSKMDNQCECYRAILLDLTMPYMDGLQVLQRLKHQHRFPRS